MLSDMDWCNRLLLLTLALIYEQLTFVCTTRRVQFTMADNTAARYVVGNILDRSNLRHPTISRVMLEPDTHFQLTLQGDLMTRQTIDRDDMCHQLQCCQQEICKLTLDAYVFESELNPTVVKLTVHISDENDNAPTFPRQSAHAEWNESRSSTWRVEIPETSPVGSRHSLPAAQDADSPRFGVKSYHLNANEWRGNYIFNEHTNKPFTLIPQPRDSSGPPQLQLNSVLDRETTSNFTMKLIAVDGGSPPLSSTLTLDIQVTDVNDNPPVFVDLSPPSGEANILNLLESTPIGTVIHRFTAVDPDIGDNARIDYSINWVAGYPQVNDTIRRQLASKYSIDRLKGHLKVTGSLDYESELERRAQLVITATDNGQPRLSTSTLLNIVLIDVNDNDPIISLNKSPEGKAFPTLMENNPTPQLVQLISVSDRDTVSQGKVVCRLGSGSSADFTLQNYSSTMYGLTSRRAFDYEKLGSTGNVSVLIQCEDNADPRGTTQRWVDVAIGDVNDNWPQFTKLNYQIHVSEDMSVGSKIGVVKAVDLDSGVRGNVTYELSTAQSEWHNFIYINPTSGSLFTKSELDREAFARMNFHVTARDGGEASGANVKTNTTTLIVFVTDVNDNAPEYIGPSELFVAEDVPVGTQLINTVLFKDIDSGENGTVVVSLAHFNADVASMEPAVVKHRFSASTGASRLTTSTRLDRESRSTYAIYLVAEDRGSSVGLTSTVKVVINVLDINDNSPELTYPRNNSLLTGPTESYADVPTLSIPADIPFHTSLVTLQVRDLDSGENGSVLHRLLPSEGSSLKHCAVDGNFQSESQPCRDGSHFLQIDQFDGHLRTAWGVRTGESSGNYSQNHTAKASKIDPPEIGIYLIRVEFSDQGQPRRKIEAHFYMNISEPIGIGLTFASLLQTNFSNTIILVLITVCSLALIVSLTGAILWVRFHSSHCQRTGQLPVEAGDCQRNTANGGRNWYTYHPADYYQQHDGYTSEQAYFGSPGRFSDHTQTLMMPDSGGKHDDWYEPAAFRQGADIYQPTCASPLLAGTLKVAPSMTMGHAVEPSDQPPMFYYPTPHDIALATFPAYARGGLVSHAVDPGPGTINNNHHHNNNSTGESDSGVDSSTGGGGGHGLSRCSPVGNELCRVVVSSPAIHPHPPALQWHASPPAGWSTSTESPEEVTCQSPTGWERPID